MPTAKKKSASKTAVGTKPARKKIATPAKAPGKKSAGATAPKPATKLPKKKAARKAAKKQPGLGVTVNMGPTRGDSSWPPSNKAMANNTSRAPVTKAHGSPANDSTRGPGGQGLQAKKQGDKGGGKNE